MKNELKERLSKLHEDARCCSADFRQAVKGLTHDSCFAVDLGTMVALADKNRLAIFKLVRQYGRLCGCEIESAFELSHSTVIHHLNQLVQAGILENQREGRWSYFEISSKFSRQWEELSHNLSSKPEQPACCCCSRQSQS
ncbi:winged helix-turn-helix transcriptional regulator [Candidatus Acetothermia bacterium]|nr:winged helix-turn-helix transcriptional regulator [Candidatus Acetothermia bacterium]MBI3643290.1 winged helix-turn-helix transcriptional regulator [Candidatus Acetothermia bacterium]